MSELPPDAAALLARARNAHGPQQADRDRVLQGLHATLGISAAAAIAATTASTASATAAAVAEGGSIAPAAGGMLGWKSALLTWKAGKVMLATVAIGGAVGVGSATLPARGPAAEQRSAEQAKTSRREAARTNGDAPTPSLAAAPAPTAAVERAAQSAQPAADSQAAGRDAIAAKARQQAASEPVSAPTAGLRARSDAARVEAHEVEAVVSARTARASEPERGERRARRERRAHKKRAHAAAARESAANSAAAAPVERASTDAAARVDAAAQSEVTLLRSALASVRDGDGHQALSLLAEHAARYPSGAFTTERRGLRVLALCAAGRSAEGQREQAAFLREAGSSPIAARVRSACNDSEP